MKTNVSLCSRVFPSYFKLTHVNLLLDKYSLPTNDLNRYRPISNLSFISKILEKSVSSRLNIHLNCNHLSAYKQFNSKEIALLKVRNIISLNMDRGSVKPLTLIHVSATFNALDYSVF